MGRWIRRGEIVEGWSGLSGSRRMVLEGIAGGLDTPIKLCNYPGVEAYAIATILRELWAQGYIRIEGRDEKGVYGTEDYEPGRYRDGVWRIELLDKGREAIGVR